MNGTDALSSLAEYEALPAAELRKRIEETKRQYSNKISILAHYYQKEEILDLSDFQGDSYQLSTVASWNSEVEAVFFCGVHFMAETADILINSGENVVQRAGNRVDVILPDLGAGCPMADMAEIEAIEACWHELSRLIDINEITPITYVNSKASLKAFCGRNGGASCTSSNAKAVLNWAFSRRRRVLFFPDQHLGRNTSLSMGIPESQIILWSHGNDVPFEQYALCGLRRPESNLPLGGNSAAAVEASRVILWNGFCPVHQKFTVDDIKRTRRDHPGAKIIVHPECNCEIVTRADSTGSTAFILKEIESGPVGSQWAVGTEWRMVESLTRSFPEKLIVNLSSQAQKCESMDRITLPCLCWAMEAWASGNAVNVVRVPEATAADALICLQRMLRCH